MILPPPLRNGNPRLWLATWELQREYLLQSTELVRFLIDKLPQTAYRPAGG